MKFYVTQNGKKVIDTKMNSYSEFTFNKPNGAYQAVFDAGEGHKVYIDGQDITE